jgi:protoporphyrinogen oxidase
MPNRPSICIIGAGLTGLVCARRLAKSGFRVQVVEQHSTSGGMLASMRIGHEYIELIPHHIRKVDRNMLALLKELGLLEELSWFDSYWYGRAGRKKLGYLEKGFHSLITALAQEITDCEGIIYYGYTAMDIAVTEEGKRQYHVSCILSDCTTIVLDADTILFTGACRNLAHITHNLDIPTDFRDSLMDITYKANMSMLLVMKTQFTGCFSRPLMDDFPFQRIIQHTNLVGERRYGGHVLYLSGAFQTAHPMWTQSDAEVFKDFFKYLQKLNPAIVRSDIRTWRLTRTRYALPTSSPGLPLITPLPGLYVCSLAMVDSALGTEEYRMDPCIAMANNMARTIEESSLPQPLPETGTATVERIY